MTFEFGFYEIVN